MSRLVLVLVLGYRLIPARVRRVWSFGKSTSHLALAELRSGDYAGLAAVRLFAHYANPHLRFPERGWAPMPGESMRDPVNWDN